MIEINIYMIIFTCGVCVIFKLILENCEEYFKSVIISMIVNVSWYDFYSTIVTTNNRDAYIYTIIKIYTENAKRNIYYNSGLEGHACI